MIYYIIKINGIYDIICALSILELLPNNITSYLHTGMFNKTLHNFIHKRTLAFFILTYGVIRIHNHKYLTTYSYIIEALYYMNELTYNTIFIDKGLFVISTSLLLAILSLCIN